LADLNKDPFHIILKSKREATRFQILVEIAEHQPSVRQQEIAEKLGITPQAVSEYIREGVEWVLTNAEALESYAHYVTHDVVQQVSVWTAIAAEDIVKGDVVGVYMDGGYLFAAHRDEAAMGEAVNDARKGQDLGVAKLSGIIDHREGAIRVCKVPRIQRGGSHEVMQEKVLAAVSGMEYIGAVGLEAVISLRKAGLVPDSFFGSREGIIEAAFHGVNCCMVIVDEEFTGFLKRLESAGLSYEIRDLSLP
jgi:putative transcriptional regulator